MALKTRHDYFGDLQVNIDTKQFTKVSKLVSRLTGVVVPPNKPIVGSNAFAHESGIHQHGMMSNPETYEIMTPESVGAEKTTSYWVNTLAVMPLLIIWQNLVSNLSQKRKSTTSSLNSKNWLTVKNKYTMMTLSLL